MSSCFYIFSILLLITSPCFPESYVSRGSLSSVSWGLSWASSEACLLTPCRWLYRLMVRAPWLLLWPLVCACLHRKCAQHRNVRRVILLHRLLAGYFGVSMGAPPSPLAGCPGTVGVIWSHLPPPYYSPPPLSVHRSDVSCACIWCG